MPEKQKSKFLVEFGTRPESSFCFFARRFRLCGEKIQCEKVEKVEIDEQKRKGLFGRVPNSTKNFDFCFSGIFWGKTRNTAILQY